MELIMLTMVLDREDSVQGFAHEWAQVLAERLDSLHVVGHRVGKYDLSDNISVYSMGKEEGASRIRKAANLISATREIISDSDIDGIFVHQIEAYGLCVYPLALLNDIPLVQFKAHKGVPFTLGIAQHLFDHFVTSSEGGLELDISNKTVIGQGIDTDRFVPDESKKDNRQLNISSIGRISPVKNYEVMLEAIADLQSRIDNPLRFRVVGEPAADSDQGYLDELKESCKSLGVENLVEFTGAVTNFEVVDIYQESDIFLNMSETGSLDKAVLEAMACEVPTITSNSAYREIFPESLRSNLTLEHGQPGELAEIIEDVYHWSEERKKQVGRRLRNIVEADHSLNQFMDRLVTVFETIKEDRTVNNINFT